jgi:hypothetical protein
VFVTAGRGNRPPARCYSLPLLAMLPALAILWQPSKLLPPPPSTNVQFQPRLLFVYGVGIALQRHTGSPALLGSECVVIGAPALGVLMRHFLVRGVVDRVPKLRGSFLLAQYSPRGCTGVGTGTQVFGAH